MVPGATPHFGYTPGSWPGSFIVANYDARQGLAFQAGRVQGLKMIILNPALMREFSAKQICEYCGRYARRMECHHMMGRGFGGGTRMDVRWNLIALCNFMDSDCHGRAQRYQIPVEEIRQIIADREGTTSETVEDFLFWLARQPRWEEIEAAFIREDA